MINIIYYSKCSIRMQLYILSDNKHKYIKYISAEITKWFHGEVYTEEIFVLKVLQ